MTVAVDELVAERDARIAQLTKAGLSRSTIARKLKREIRFIPINTTPAAIRRVIRDTRQTLK